MASNPAEATTSTPKRSKRSPEYEALTESYPKLVDCIARSPADVADKLMSIFSKDEIDDLRTIVSDRQKARKIIDIVIAKVECEPSFFTDFTSIMEREGWAKFCIDDLKANLNAKQESQSNAISENIEIGSPNPHPLTPVPVLPPAIPVLPLSIPVLQPAIQTAIDIYAFVSNETSHITTKKQFDESDLRNETDKIKRKFASLITNITMALEKNGVTTFNLVFHLSELGSICSDNIYASEVLLFNKEFIRQIEKECASNVSKVFTMLHKYYSWINFGLIESIIDAFLKHDERIQEIWTEYQKCYKEYCKERVCKIPKPLNGRRIMSFFRQRNTEVAFKIDHEWHEIRFDMLSSIQASISRLLGLKPYTLYLKTVKQGCVELVFEVPQHVADVIFPPTEEQLLALQKQFIKYCGIKRRELHLRQVSTNEESSCEMDVAPEDVMDNEEDGAVLQMTSLQIIQENVETDPELTFKQRDKLQFVSENEATLKQPPVTALRKLVNCLHDYFKALEQKIKNDHLIKEETKKILAMAFRHQGSDKTDSREGVDFDLRVVNLHIQHVFENLIEPVQFGDTTRQKVITFLFRWAAGLAYCYYLIKCVVITYIEHLTFKGIVETIGSALSQLFMHLRDVQFGDLLKQMGGWKSIIPIVPDSESNLAVAVGRRLTFMGDALVETTPREYLQVQFLGMGLASLGLGVLFLLLYLKYQK